MFVLVARFFLPCLYMASVIACRFSVWLFVSTHRVICVPCSQLIGFRFQVSLFWRLPRLRELLELASHVLHCGSSSMPFSRRGCRWTGVEELRQWRQLFRRWRSSTPRGMLFTAQACERVSLVFVAVVWWWYVPRIEQTVAAS